MDAVVEAGTAAPPVVVAHAAWRLAGDDLRSGVWQREAAGGCEERHSGNAVRLSRTLLATPRPAPLLGEHSRDVLARWLGIDEPAVAELVATGVCC